MEITPWDEITYILPPLGTEDLSKLKASIEKDGVKQSILVLPDGRIIDGHHRWKLSGGEAPYEILDIPEFKAFDLAIELNLARRQLSRQQIAEVKEAQSKKKQEMKELAAKLRNEGKTQQEVADEVGVAQNTISDWENVSIIGNESPDNAYIQETGPPPDNRVTIPREHHAIILDRLESGETQAQLAADYQVTQQRIAQIARREKKKRKVRQEKLAPKPASKSPTLIISHAEDMPLDDETIDVIITSPPYNLGQDCWPMGGDGRVPREDGIGYQDNLQEEDYQYWQLNCLKEIFRVAKVGASLFYNHKVRIKDGVAIHPMGWIGSPENPWTLRQEIIWDRGSTHNHSALLFWPEDERIYWMTKGKPRIESDSIGMSTVWKEHGPVAGTWHPAPFTEKLPKMCFDALGLKSAVVLDPFAGSCTVLKVALELGYDAIGVDVSKQYLERSARENGWTLEKSI